MTHAKVSVLIPVHNGEGYIGKAIRSVLAQGFRDFELIVLDDGSTDGSARVARAFGDSRIRVYRRQEHEGVAATRNHLLLVARHPLIAFLDVDDVAFPERLAKQVAFLDKNRDVALVSSAYVVIDAQGQTLRHRSMPHAHDALSTRLLHGIPMPASTVLVKRQAIDSVGGFDLTAGLAAEYDLFLRIAEKEKVAALSEPLVKCRVHVRAVSYARRRELHAALDEARRRAVLRRYVKPLAIVSRAAEGTATAIDGAAAAPADAALTAAAVDAPVASAAIDIASAAPTEAAPAEMTEVATAGGAGADALPAPLAAQEAPAPGAAASATAPPAGAPGPAEVLATTSGQTNLPFETAAAASAADDAGGGTGVIAAITVPSAETADPSQVAAAPASDGVGEIAIVEGAPRSAVPAAPERIPRAAVVLVATGRSALAAIRSVLDQTLADVTLAVVATVHDEGLERGLELLGDERVLFLEALGATRARALNLGVLATRSQYLAYLTEASVYRPEHLERLVQFAEAERLGFVYSDLGLATPGMPGSAVLGKDYDAQLLLRENYIPAEAVLHRRELLDEVGLFNEGLEAGMEWELWAYLTRVASTRRLPVVTVDRVLGGPKALKLIAPSPARVRKYLAEKFNASPREESPSPLQGARQERLPDGDAVARAQERFKLGDWAGAAAELVEAASKPFAALSQIFSPRFPERELPAAEAVTPDAAAGLVSRGPRQNPPPESPMRREPPRSVAYPMRAPERGPAQETARRSLPEPEPVTLPTPVTSRLVREPERAQETPEVMLDEAAGAGGGAYRPRGTSWLMTHSGIVGTGKSRAAGGHRVAARGATRPLYSGPSFGNRRKAMASLTQNPACPLCGDSEPALAYRAGWYRVLDCGSCNVAFSHPRLEPTLAARFFSDRRPDVVPPFLQDASDLGGTAFDRSRELSWVRRHVSSGKLVDVGCSWGYALVQARALGFEVLGTELSRTLSRIARERFNLEVVEKDFGDLPLEDEAMDAVLAVHVLHHFLDPRAFLAAAGRALRPGGVLVGSVPNFESYLRETLGRRWKWLDPESQPHHFRPSPLLRELEAAGFEVELWTSEGLYGEAAILECLSPEQAETEARAGRGSEIGFIAVKR